ncbi:MAG: GerMN domain-containing protein [Clostridiales bacterium]|nr:GerMN domain-containing protein [Clostridiales bacterium]
MKKKIGITAAAVALMLVLAACGDTVETVTAEESGVPEMSSGEMLVDGLEYLLSEDKEDVIQIPNAGEEISGVQEETEGASGAEDTASDSAGTDTEPVEMVLYYSNGTFDSLDSETLEVEKITADVIVSALARHNIVSIDTKALSLEEEETEEGKLLYLDLSEAVNGYLRTMTREAESIIIASITDTFLENYEADGIYLTVEGKVLKTSYAVYDEMLEWCLPQDLIDAGQEE